MRRTALQAFLAAALLAGLACAPAALAEDGMGDFNPDVPGIGRFKPRGMPPAAAGVERGRGDAPAVAGRVDMAPFFRRLEDLGFDTRYIRDVTTRIEVFFREPGGDAEAEWGYILDNLYIPDSFKQQGSDRIRYDLRWNELDTIIHEYTHAARDVLSVSEKSPKGAPAHAHFKALEAIWANLRSRSVLYRYAWMKADEVTGYFMGAAVSRVFETADDIILYNKVLGGSGAATVEEAGRLGGTLSLPSTRTARDPWERRLAQQCEGAPFGRNKVYDSAMFKDNSLSGPALIRWEEMDWVKDLMYQNILDLKPPKDCQELLRRLNTLDNEWIRGVRSEVSQARLRNARKASRPQ